MRIEMLVLEWYWDCNKNGVLGGIMRLLNCYWNSTKINTEYIGVGKRAWL